MNNSSFLLSQVESEMTLNDLHLKIILIDRKWSISVKTLLYLTSSNSSISSFELNNFFLISWTVFFGWNLNSVWLIHFEVRLSLKITTIKLFFVSCSVIWIICFIWASWILQIFFASSIKVFRILFFTFLGFKNNRYFKKWTVQMTETERPYEHEPKDFRSYDRPH